MAFLKELKEKVIGEFYTFNNYNSGSDKIDNRNMDTFLLKIKYEIDKVKTDVLKEKNEDDSIGIEFVLLFI